MKTHLITVTEEDIFLGQPGVEFGSPLQTAIRRAFPYLLSIRVNQTMVECYKGDDVLLAALPYEATQFERRFQLGGRVRPISFSMKEPE